MKYMLTVLNDRFVLQRKHLCMCFSEKKENTSISPDQQRHTTDVVRFGGKGRGNRSLSLRQRDADISSPQCSTVISAVSTHAHSITGEGKHQKGEYT